MGQSSHMPAEAQREGKWTLFLMKEWQDSGSTYGHLWRIQSATVICILFQVNVSFIFICISEELAIIFFIFVNCCFVFGCVQLCILYFVWLKISPFSFSKYYQRFVELVLKELDLDLSNIYYCIFVLYFLISAFFFNNYLLISVWSVPLFSNESNRIMAHFISVF